MSPIHDRSNLSHLLGTATTCTPGSQPKQTLKKKTNNNKELICQVVYIFFSTYAGELHAISLREKKEYKSETKRDPPKPGYIQNPPH